MTKIEWTRGDDGSAGKTWNPTSGCDKVSPGCGLARPGSDDNETGQTGGCYAMAMAKRLKGMGSAKYQNDGDPRTSGPGFGIAMHPDVLDAPLRWRKPHRVFVNSMSDLFHDKVTDDFIAKVWAVMAAAPQHTFQILTKRHARMRFLLNSDAFAHQVAAEMARLWKVGRVAPLRGPLPHVWLGVSVEDQKWADIRIPALLDTPAAVRFLSCEPLLGPVDLCGPLDATGGHRPRLTYWLTGRPDFATDGTPTVGPRIDWVIAGGESGPKARPMHPHWVRALRDQCAAAGVPYFYKQAGEYTWQASGGYRAPELYVSRETGQTLPDHEVPATGDWQGVWRVGKKTAGRELDGRTHDDYPQAVAS